METKFIKPLVFLTICTVLLVNSCDTPAHSIHDVKLNQSIKKRFQPGQYTSRPLFQYGQASDGALDIVVPIDPSGTQEIAKAHNYYLSKGSNVEFNIETLVKFSTYEIDEDLEDRGELIIPQQWMSVCTLLDPITGRKLKDTDGDDVDISFNSDDTSIKFTSYLTRCTGYGPPNHPYLTEGGYLVQPCERLELGGATDPFRGQSVRTTNSYPLCMLGARFPLQESSTFGNTIKVNSYNDASLRFEDLTFQTSIKPTFMVVDHTITKYIVHMTPSPNNAAVASGPANNNSFLNYEFQMPIIDGWFKDNFASNISIDYVRFYWTDSRNNLLPIVNDPRFGGNPSHSLQVGFGSACHDPDANGFFRANPCTLLNNYTPACPKGDLDNRVIWKLKVYYESYNLDVVNGWSLPVAMEFGLKVK